LNSFTLPGEGGPSADLLKAQCGDERKKRGGEGWGSAATATEETSDFCGKTEDASDCSSPRKEKAVQLSIGGREEGELRELAEKREGGDR